MKKDKIPYKKKKTMNNAIAFEIGVERGFVKSVYKTPFKMKKQVWFDEYADADPFTPSCPHLHSSDGKYKLNVYNGEMYDIRTKKIARDKYISEDELKILWSDPRFLLFAKKMREMYYEKFPNSKLPDIPHFD